MTPEHFDVVIVGAGLSGIGAAHHLQQNSPKKTYVILEGRDAIGGTWDLFRYPGIRSDSDMYTLGYRFRPWREAKAIADGISILNYVRDTATEGGIDRHIRFHHMVRHASWNSETATWTVETAHGPDGEKRLFTCNFLFMCSGYYDYAGGHDPAFPGAESFQGRIVHPQKWPEDLDYAGKRVVIIGSGATAVTLVPAMAKEAAHVTMLQRSPTYVVSRPAEDALANTLRRYLPGKLAYAITRWRNVLLGMYFYRLARSKPMAVKDGILKMVRAELGPDYDIATHFTPRYNPWDQRLCLVPDSDLFAAIKSGAASVVTDQIDAITPTGIRLRSGEELPADIIVTATGLKLIFLGGLTVDVDGEPVDFPSTTTYKGMMYSGVPNLAASFGYTNASWTLKADLTCEYVCRLLNYMDRTGTRQCTPRLNGDVAPAPYLDFSSGYVQRALHLLPRQGQTTPWKMHQNYAMDLLALRFGKVNDGVMEFTKPQPRAAVAPEKVLELA
jgi:cation diffusion facilitator CzcD-associated flavoprotein CzcO